VPRKGRVAIAKRRGQAHFHPKNRIAPREYRINHDASAPPLSDSRSTPDVQLVSAVMTTNSKYMRAIASVSMRATEVFGSREKALRWLDTLVPSLGYRTPLSLLSTAEGIADVEDTLGAIEHGVW